MAKSMCPECGHSPIADGARECPKCHEPFDFLARHKRRQVDALENDLEGTQFGGGITSAVTAHPGPVGGVLFLAGAAWFFRAGGVFSAENTEPRWLYGLVAAHAVAGLLLFLSWGPARLLAGVVCAAGIGSALALDWPLWKAPLPLSFVAVDAVALSLLLGEAGPVRRYLSLGLGLLTAGVCAAVLFVGAQPLAAPHQVRLDGGALGFELLLPPGFEPSAPGPLGQGLSLPGASADFTSAAFFQPGGSLRGAVIVQAKRDRDAGGCASLAKLLGVKGEPQPVLDPAPSAFGSTARAFRLPTAPDTHARLACLDREDAPRISLVVVGSGTDAQATAAAFAQVGAGLSLK